MISHSHNLPHLAIAWSLTCQDYKQSSKSLVHHVLGAYFTMSKQLHNIQAASRVLETRVLSALRTQLGDQPRLAAVTKQALALSSAAEQVCPMIDHLRVIVSYIFQHLALILPAEYTLLQDNILCIVDNLDHACHQLLDPLDGPALVVVQTICTGHQGRSWIEINPHFLSYALSLQGPSSIAPTVGISSRTIWCCALQYGLVEPQAPVLQTVLGSQQTIHTSTSSLISDISDEQLDAAISAILQIFPMFGRCMITCHLQDQGH